MSDCQIGQLHTPAGEDRVSANKQRVGSLARKTCESRLDFAAGTRTKDLDLHSHDASRGFQVVQCGLGLTGFFRIDEHRQANGPRAPFAQQLQPLRCHFARDEVDARHVTLRAGDAGYKTKIDRVSSDEEHHRDRCCCRFGCRTPRASPIAQITPTR